jgi:hypothetical protein
VSGKNILLKKLLSQLRKPTFQLEITIPAGTLKYISEYNINASLYCDCDLLKYPKRSQVRTLQFMKDESPYVFCKRIAYRVGKSSEPIQFENQFYVSEITNYAEKRS